MNSLAARMQQSASVEMWTRLEASLARLVYGSNMIESAGSSLAITIKLCEAVFRGDEVCASEIDERDEAYQKALENLRATNRPAARANVIQSRREIVQHAQALNYVINRVVLAGDAWSEAIILEAHRILHDGLDDTVEAGKYRTYEVAVKYEKPGQKKQKASLCMRAKAVPGYMKEMVEQLNKEIADAADNNTPLDPYTLAARYHHQFVNIHPFGDGNGRISHIILDVLLLESVGRVSEFGLDAEEREQYIAIATRASKIFHDEDMEVEFGNHTGHFELAKFVLSKSERD